MILEAIKSLCERVASLILDIFNWPSVALKKHLHPYQKRGEPAQVSSRLAGLNDFSPKQHSHPYISTNPYLAKNVLYLSNKSASAFAPADHNHDDSYQKKTYFFDKLVAQSAQTLYHGGAFIHPQALLSPFEHSHSQYFKRGERVWKAKRLSGHAPSEIALERHEHPFVRKNDSRYKRKTDVVNKAKAISRGKLIIVRGEQLSGSVSVNQQLTNMTVIGYQMLASVAGKSLDEIRSTFKVITPREADTCMEYIHDAAWDPKTNKAITRYLVVFVSTKTYRKLQPVLYNAAVYMGDTVPPLNVNFNYPISILDAENKSSPVSSVAASVGFTKKIWIPLVPPASTNSWLSVFDQILFALGSMFIVIITAVSLMIAAIINAILDIFVVGFKSLAQIPIIGLLFVPIYEALLTLCVKPIGIFRTMDSGVLVPMVFVQVQLNDKPTHWLVPDRVYGLNVVVRNVYTVVNKHRVTVGGLVTDILGVAGGYFANLDEAISKYCKRFEAHFPVPFTNAMSVDGFNVARVAEDVYLARYVKPWDPTRVRFQAMAAGPTVVMFNSGLPYTFVCFSK